MERPEEIETGPILDPYRYKQSGDKARVRPRGGGQRPRIDSYEEHEKAREYQSTHNRPASFYKTTMRIDEESKMLREVEP